MAACRQHSRAARRGSVLSLLQANDSWTAAAAEVGGAAAVGGLRGWKWCAFGITFYSWSWYLCFSTVEWE